MNRRSFCLGIGAAMLAVIGMLPQSANASVAARHLKIRYQSSGGIAGIVTDLKVYDNGDAVLVSGAAITGGPRTLHLTASEYHSLLSLFTTYHFNLMPPAYHHTGMPIADGMFYSVTLYTGSHKKTVASETMASESHGYTVIRNALASLASRVAQDGSDDPGLKATLSVVQHGPKVDLTFTLKNITSETKYYTPQHLGHWMEFEAWTHGERVWLWSDGKVFPMVAVHPMPIAPGASITMHDEWDFTGSMTGLHQPFTFRAYSLYPHVPARKTVVLDLPLMTPAAGGSSGGAGIIDGLGGSH